MWTASEASRNNNGFVFKGRFSQTTDTLKLFSSKRLSFFFSHVCEIQNISDQKRLKRE